VNVNTSPCAIALLKLTASITASSKHCFYAMKNVEIIAFILVARTSSNTEVRKSILYVFAAWQQSRCVVSARNPHQLHNFVQKKAVTKAFQLLVKTHFSNLKNLDNGFCFRKTLLRIFVVYLEGTLPNVLCSCQLGFGGRLKK
jgi:hypothetical protein